MPTSAAQTTANRANAQLSTGPRSEAGKRASSLNSVTDGLCSIQIFVRPEEESAFHALESSLLEELQPDGVLQNEFFAAILHAAWNLRRCSALETHIQNEASAKGLIDALLDDELGRKLDRIYRYKKTHESSHRRALASLRQLQTEQLWRQTNQQFVDQSILADTTSIEIRLGRVAVNEEKLKFHQMRKRIESFIAPASQ